MGNSGSNENCIFCKICQKQAPETEIHAENDTLVIFSDIHPAAKQHYLIVPKQHLHSPKTLHTQEHIDLINQMVEFGVDYLKKQGGNEEDMRIGFHWPPFTSVNHLHLHVIYPSAEMGILYKTMYHNSVFVSPEYVIDYVKAKL